MEFHFNYTGPMEEEVMEIVAGIYAVAIIAGLVVSLAVFLIRGFSLYTIARRRGLDKPWLAWIPVANNWIIGSVSDQYRYLVKDEIRSRRKYLFAFAVCNTVLGTVALVLAAVTAVKVGMSYHTMSDAQMASALMTPVITVLILSGVMGILSLTEYVLRQMCMYDLYRSCDPGNATAYLVLGILFSVLEPIFLICLRKRDNGLPPRRVQPNYE